MAPCIPCQATTEVHAVQTYLDMSSTFGTINHQPQTGINNQHTPYAPLSHFSQLQPARIRRAVNGQHIVLVAVIKKTETILETK